MNCRHGYNPENCPRCAQENELERQQAFRESVYPEQTKAKRSPVDYRFDILEKDFLYMMAKIAHLGSFKYGDYNWQKSRLTGGAGPINHAYMHLRSYETKDPHDTFDDYRVHLVAAAFNLMMEYWYACHIDRQEAK